MLLDRLTSLSGAARVVESSQHSIGFEPDFSISSSWNEATRTEYRAIQTAITAFWIVVSHGEVVSHRPNADWYPSNKGYRLSWHQLSLYPGPLSTLMPFLPILFRTRRFLCGNWFGEFGMIGLPVWTWT
jgi:hypothetical protein